MILHRFVELEFLAGEGVDEGIDKFEKGIEEPGDYTRVSIPAS